MSRLTLAARAPFLDPGKKWKKWAKMEKNGRKARLRSFPNERRQNTCNHRALAPDAGGVDAATSRSSGPPGGVTCFDGEGYGQDGRNAIKRWPGGNGWLPP